MKIKKENPAANYIIVAPHPDDEIIGCFEILKKHKTIVIYSADINQERRLEAMKLKEFVDVKAQLFLDSVPTHLLNPNTVALYFPDPIYEIHPDHRKWGVIGESIARLGFNVIFYSVNMQAPYIHEVKNPKEKEELLQNVYPSQSDLWKYDKKYILFEGRCQWIF